MLIKQLQQKMGKDSYVKQEPTKAIHKAEGSNVGKQRRKEDGDRVQSRK